MDLPKRTLHIEETINFDKQLKQLCSPQGFGDEGKEFSTLEFKYFVLLQNDLTQKSMQPIKFHAPFEHSVNTLHYQGQEHTLKDRSLFWDGHRLYLLSQCHYSNGAYSLFRRAMRIPTNPDGDVQFFAILTPLTRSDLSPAKQQSFLIGVTKDYDVCAVAYQAIYPYLRPKLVKYHTNNTLSHKPIMPALLTHSQAGWDSLDTLFKGKQDLTPTLFMGVINWFLSVYYLHTRKYLHRDLTDTNVIVIGPGVMCQLIDMSTAICLGEEKGVTEPIPLSTYPDFSAGTEYDPSSDRFSIAMNLLTYYAVDRTQWCKQPVRDLNKKTHKQFANPDDITTRTKHFSQIHAQIQGISPTPCWKELFPHLLAFTHPDRSKRPPSLNTLFSDPVISKKIQDHIVQIARELSSDFVSIKNLSLTITIGQLALSKDPKHTASTTIMMLLANALHFNGIPKKIRINHKHHIERLFLHMPVSPITMELLYHYEPVFPGLLTQSLMKKAIRNFDRSNDSLFFLEILTNQAVIKTIDAITDRLISDAYQQAIKMQCQSIRDTLIDDAVNHVICKETLEDTIEKIIDNESQKDLLITTIIHDLSLNVSSHLDRQQARSHAQQQLANWQILPTISLKKEPISIYQDAVKTENGKTKRELSATQPTLLPKI